MTVRHRSAVLALLLIIGSQTILLTAQRHDSAWAGPRPVPARTAQEARPGIGVAEPSAAPLPAPPGSPCPDDPPTPVVGIRIRVPASVGPGQEIDYCICVENRSEADAHGVIVRSPLPAHARFVRANPEPASREPELVWRLGTLQAGTCRQITLILTATGTGDINNCARVQFEHGQCVVTRIARPNLKVHVCGPTQAAVNEPLMFQIAVSNQGEVEATGVGLIKKLPEGLVHASGKSTLAWDIGNLAPGQCRQVEYQVTASKPGRWCSKVTASAAGGVYADAESCVEVGGQALPPMPPAQPVPPTPAATGLNLIKMGPQQRFLNRPATYQITVSNPNAVPVQNVVITDQLPAQTTLVSASDNGRLNGTQVQWSLGALPPGGRRTVQIALQTQVAGEIVNRATATADGGLTTQAEAKTRFEGAAGLTFDIEVKDNPVEVGAQTTYVVSVFNQGMVPATKVQIAVTLPDAVEFVNAKGPTNFRPEGKQIIFEAMPALAPRGEVRFELNVKALRPGEVKCRAELRAEQLGERPVVREQTTTIYPADAPAKQP